MILDYIGVKEINGSLIVIDDVENAFFEETVDIRLDDGSFRHVLSDRNGDLMATEQCMYALTAVSRIERGESSLYRMQTETP